MPSTAAQHPGVRTPGDAPWSERRRAARALAGTHPHRRIFKRLKSYLSSGTTDAGVLTEMVACCRRLRSNLDGIEAEILQRLQDAHPGTGTAEELAARLRITTAAADRMLNRAAALDDYAEVHFALLGGEIDLPKAEVFIDATRTLPDAQARAIHRTLLPGAPDLTSGQLRHRLRAAVLAVDADLAQERHEEAATQRHVSVTAADDGMAYLTFYLPATEAVAAMTTLDCLAVKADPDDDRPVGARRVDAFTDLINQTMTSGRTPEGRPVPTQHRKRPHLVLTIAQSTLDGDDDSPGYLAGYGPLPAEVVRHLAAESVPSPTVAGTNAAHAEVATTNSRGKGTDATAAQTEAAEKAEEAAQGEGTSTTTVQAEDAAGTAGEVEATTPTAAQAEDAAGTAGEVEATTPTAAQAEDAADGAEAAQAEDAADGAEAAQAAEPAVAAAQAERTHAAGTRVRGTDITTARAGRVTTRAIRTDAFTGTLLPPNPAPVTFVSPTPQGCLLDHDPIASIFERLQRRQPTRSETPNVRTDANGTKPDDAADPVAVMAALGILSSDTYQPAAALREYILTRDATCRFPTCRQPARRCQFDHIVAFDPTRPAWTQTHLGNLHLLCARHHQLKTAGVWSVRRDHHTGDTHWTSPLGYHHIKPAEVVDPAHHTDELVRALITIRAEHAEDPGWLNRAAPVSPGIASDAELDELTGRDPTPLDRHRVQDFPSTTGPPPF
ncbi:DUF222 domain-containing protein [Pseudactinotalea sp. Z1739]|uniref:HNH endonuclease signature motif containing protein n=1 Tax=Pseudactinotalea sp. Z1739 TaxID=3413028 RepID=UPI003C7DEF43